VVSIGSRVDAARGCPGTARTRTRHARGGGWVGHRHASDAAPQAAIAKAPPACAPIIRRRASARPALRPVASREDFIAETEGEAEAVEVGVFSNTGVSHQGARQGRQRSGGTTVAATQSYAHSTAVRSSQNPHCQCGQGHTAEIR
jgi:hypothetical protein